MEITYKLTYSELLELIVRAQETSYNNCDGTTLDNEPEFIMSLAKNKIVKTESDFLDKLQNLDKYEAELVNSGDDDNSEVIEFTKSEHYGDWVKVQDLNELIEEIKSSNHGKENKVH